MVGYDQNSFITSLDRFNDKKLMQTNPKGCAVQIFNNSALGLKKCFLLTNLMQFLTLFLILLSKPGQKNLDLNRDKVLSWPL